jgi:hypothetical protein
MIFCIVISLPCVFKSISLCSNKLCFILAFQATTLVCVVCEFGDCYKSFVLSCMLLCDLGNCYRRFLLNFMLLCEVGNELHVVM